MKHVRKNMVGLRFAALVGIKFSHVRKNKAYWVFRCDCGQEKVIGGAGVRNGSQISCGGHKAEDLSRRLTKHGMAGSPTYTVWQAMKSRCKNKNNKDFKDYGGRGIYFCKRWEKFENFMKDMGIQPPGLTLERVDNDKGYSKGNCTWATRLAQANNKRKYKTKNPR